MNDIKVKGKPHIDAKTMAMIYNQWCDSLAGNVGLFLHWNSTSQGYEFWDSTYKKLQDRN